MFEQYGGHEQKPTEDERKFLIHMLPHDLESYQHARIQQGYLAIGSDGSEVRVRDQEGSYTLTVKSKGDLSRGEWEAAITPEQFETWWPATAGKRIFKTRYSIPYEGHTIELDLYDGPLRGMAVAEVEFSDTAEAALFIPPEWFSSEVTYDDNYKNKNLAINGRPYDFTG